jgi:hypothetical protein
MTSRTAPGAKLIDGLNESTTVKRRIACLAAGCPASMKTPAIALKKVSSMSFPGCVREGG